MSTNGGNEPTPSIDDLTERIRRNQTTPKPGLFAGRSPAQIALIGVVGLLLACVALSVAFVVIGIAAPALIIAAITLLVLAFKRPAIVTNVATRWPFRVLPSMITSDPVRFAVMLACVLIPISGIAGATVYRGVFSGSGNRDHHPTPTTLAAITNTTPAPTVSIVVVTNTATAAAVVSSPTPTRVPTPTPSPPDADTEADHTNSVGSTANPITSGAHCNCRAGNSRCEHSSVHC